MPKRRNPSPSQELRTWQILQKAWQHIHANGRHSKSRKTQKEISHFKIDETTNLQRIQRQLRKRTYQFSPAIPVLLKKKRPLVISTVQDRIVQRALLEVLQSKPQIKEILQVPTSFGAISAEGNGKEKKGVSGAIQALINTRAKGATHFYKSDIVDFFPQIPRQKVVETLSNIVQDSDFSDLLERATNLEVEELRKLINYKQYFEFQEIGTPQGCCLSPLIGNVLLEDFDREMNTGDVTCLRYVDDFLILGPTMKAVKAAFKRAWKILDRDGLTAYTAEEHPDKAKIGRLDQRFEYLGVEVHNEMIRPSRKAQRGFINDIKQIKRDSLNVNFSLVEDGTRESASFVATLEKISNKVRGWGEQYKFCTDTALWGSMDREISNLVEDYFEQTISRKRNMKSQFGKPWQNERRLLGVYLLSDCKKEPIST